MDLLPHLGSDDVAALPWSAAVEAIARAAVTDHAGGTARSAVPLVRGEFLLMPAESPDAVGIKVLTIAPDNPALGAPRIQGVYLVFDQLTLTPRALIDGPALGGYRHRGRAVNNTGGVEVTAISCSGRRPRCCRMPNGFIGIETALRYYGVVCDGRTLLVDEELTAQMRAERLAAGARSGETHTVSTETDSLTITEVQVLDADGGLRPGPVHLSGGRIVGVGPDAESPAGEVRQLDGRGGTVIPGLIDAHFHAYGAHLDMFRGESRPLSWVAIAGARRLGRALRRGFTTVRDVAGGDAGLAGAIVDGLLDSPRYLWTGPALSQAGGHGDPRPGDLDCCVGHHHGSEVVDGVDALRVAVRDRFRRGAHAIKIMTSGGVISLTDPIRIPQYSPEEVRAVTEEAARRGSYVAAHAYSPEAIVHSVTNGVRSIEHGNLLDAPTAALMAEHGAFLVPTLATYDAMGRRGEEIGLNPIARGKNAEVLDAGRHAIELAVDAGVSVGFGTDLMGDLEEEQLQGVRAQVEVLGLIEALRSMTLTNAALIGRDDLGRVEQGAVADLLLLPGDPTADPSLLWTGPRTVIQGGAVVRGGTVGDTVVGDPVAR